MVTYSSLREKFFDKGYFLEFNYLVLPPSMFDTQRALNNGISLDILLENWEKAINKVYGKEWEEWDTWIDYQKHK